MPKQFYTEKDVEDMFRRGEMSLEIHDGVVLTALAYEKAGTLGLKLVSERPDNPPVAPVRPYVSKCHGVHVIAPSAAPGAAPPPADVAPGEAGLHQRIRDAVIARLDAQVDANLLDMIIKRVLSSTGVK